MAQNPEEHADTYGLSKDLLSDIEDDEGAPMPGAQHGENRTRVPEHTHRVDRGSKTFQRSKDIIRGRL